MFTINKSLRRDILGIEMSGKITKEEYQKLDETIEEFKEGVENLRLLLVIKKFEWESFDAFWKELKMDLKYLKDVKKVALVSDTEWVGKTAETVKALTPNIQVDTFEMSEEENAVKWLERR